MRKKINRINEITKLIVKKHLREAIEYDPSHRERMDQSIEQSLGQDTHPFGGSPSLPGTGTSQKYSEKLNKIGAEIRKRQAFEEKRFEIELKENL